MFMYFDLSIRCGHYPTSQHVMSHFPSHINVQIIPNLQVCSWIFIWHWYCSACKCRSKQKQTNIRPSYCELKAQMQFRMSNDSICWCFDTTLPHLQSMVKLPVHSVIHKLISCVTPEFAGAKSIGFLAHMPIYMFAMGHHAVTFWRESARVPTERKYQTEAICLGAFAEWTQHVSFCTCKIHVLQAVD